VPPPGEFLLVLLEPPDLLVVLGEGVLERVRGLGEDALLVDQLHGSQRAQQRVALAADRTQVLDEALREVAADDGGGLPRALRRLVQPVDARHDHVVDRVGDDDVVKPGGKHEAAVLDSDRAGFVQRAHDLLDIERVALGLGRDGAPERVG
jgi:hypothetical protein